MSTRKIALSTLWQIASQVTMAALSIIAAKFVAIGLSKELAGEYNTTYGYLQIFGILADFGLYAVSMREVSRASHEERSRVLGAFLVIRIFTMIVALGSAVLFAWIIPQWNGTPLPLGISLAALVPGFTLLAGVLRTVFQVEYKLHYVFIAEVTQRIVTVLLTGAIIWMGVRRTDDVTYYYLFLLFGGIGAAVLLLLSYAFSRRLLRVRPVFDRTLLKKIGTLAAPYGIAFLFTTLYRQCDVTLIGLLRSDYDLQNAYYGFVQRIMDMAYLLPTFLLNSTLPLLSARQAKGEQTKDFVGTILLISLLLGSIAFLFAFFWPRAIMQLLTTDDYLSTLAVPGSDTALKILSLSMLFGNIITFSFYCLLSTHRWKPLVGTLSIGVVLALALNIQWIPTEGFVGAAKTSVIVQGILALLLLPQSLRILPARIRLKDFFRFSIFLLLLALFLALTGPLLDRSLLTVLALGCVTVWMVFLALVTGIHKMFTAK